MTIKEAFEKSENGTLTHEQFAELTKDSKFADLSTGEYVSKHKFDDEIASKDKQINTLNETVVTRNADLEAIQKKLAEAGADKTALEQLTGDLSALQNKYTTDMESYKAQLQSQAYEFAVKEFAATKQFTSKAAKRDFVQAMIAKNLQMQDGTIMGAEDFVKLYSTDNDDAFVVETATQTGNNKPKFVTSTTEGNEPKDDDKEAFKWNFLGVR